MIAKSTERRLREIARENKPGFWRVEGFGRDMVSFKIYMNGSKREVDLYIGSELVSKELLPTSERDCYLLYTEMLDRLL